jgi:hypothetical protein
MHVKWFFLLLAFGSLESAKPQSASDACRAEIQQIDKEVEKLEKQKQIHQDLARKYQKQGDNWQYYSNSVQDGYAAWGKADQERRKAIDIQTQIDLLLQKKNRIIQFYPELYEP